MARRGWSTVNFLRYAAGPITAVPLSFSCWAKTSIATTLQMLVGLYTSGSLYNRNSFRMFVGTSDNITASTADGSTANNATTTTALSAGSWFHAGAAFASITSRAAYLNGGGKATNATSTTPAGINRFSVGLGDGSTATVPFGPSGTGDVAELAVWNIALGDGDFLALAKGCHPFQVHPEALVAYFPLSGRSSPEINLLDAAWVLSVQGTLSAAEHPRVIMPKRRSFFMPSVPGGGRLIRGGALTDGGSLIKGRLAA